MSSIYEVESFSRKFYRMGFTYVHGLIHDLRTGNSCCLLTFVKPENIQTYV